MSLALLVTLFLSCDFPDGVDEMNLDGGGGGCMVFGGRGGKFLGGGAGIPLDDE